MLTNTKASKVSGGIAKKKAGVAGKAVKKAVEVPGKPETAATVERKKVGTKNSIEEASKEMEKVG